MIQRTKFHVAGFVCFVLALQACSRVASVSADNPVRIGLQVVLIGDVAGTVWEGEIHLSDGKLRRLGGHQLDNLRDRIDLSDEQTGRWKILLSNEKVPEIAQIDPARLAEQVMIHTGGKGFFASLDASPSTVVTLESNLGSASLRPGELSLGEARSLLDGRALVRRVPGYVALDSGAVHEDAPSLCLDDSGTPWVVYIEYSHQSELLRVAKVTPGGIEPAGILAGPGLFQQPSIVCDASGTLWPIWAQLEAGKWQLRARSITAGKLGDPVAITQSEGNEFNPDAGSDSSGRVWVVWQSLRSRDSEVYAKTFDPETSQWSRERRIGESKADWEPRLAFGPDGTVYVVFDSYRNGDYDIFLATMSKGHGSDETEIAAISASPDYEARPEAVVSADGKSIWMAWDTGQQRWGKHSKGAGLHRNRFLRVVRYDLATKQTVSMPDVNELLPSLPGQGGELAELAVDGEGDLWLLCRYVNWPISWQVVALQFDVGTGSLTRPVLLPESALSADRRADAVFDRSGKLWLAWAGDGRRGKIAGQNGIFVGSLDTEDPMPPGTHVEKKKLQLMSPAGAAARPAEDRHRWKVNGKEYVLYWGDLHRHTDFSVCQTPMEGSTVEHFRYALDVAKLDYLAVTDHVQHGKVLSDYEWWLTQKLSDLYHLPSHFVSIYGYERSQRWPYGHRNVLFLDRGGPLVLRTREGYQVPAPPEALDANRGYGGEQRIRPEEMWDVIRSSGRRAITLGHTIGHPLMGTDWSVYERIDREIESLVEIYQGHRVSYEGMESPQPSRARESGAYFTQAGRLVEMDPAKVEDYMARDVSGRNPKGLYHTALQLGFKLGVTASSDHLSTSVSYGGVYVETLNREGIFDALDARRTIAATDKIYVDFSCNGRLMGEVFETDQLPRVSLYVHGTGKLENVVVVRNEKSLHVFEPGTSGPGTEKFETVFTDMQPVTGENRYYIRVQQKDGNMAWTSPVWATYRP